MRLGWRWCGSSAQWGLVWKLCLIRPGWHWCGDSARWDLVSVGVEALPDEAWLALVRRLCSMKPGWRWCGSSAQGGLAWKLCLMRPGRCWCGGSAEWGLVGVGVETLILALVWKFCPMRPGWCWCGMRPGWRWVRPGFFFSFHVLCLCATLWVMTDCKRLTWRTTNATSQAMRPRAALPETTR